MNIVNLFSLVSKIGEYQLGLTDYFDLNLFSKPIYKKYKKRCKNIVNENNGNQLKLSVKKNKLSFKSEIKNNYDVNNCLDNFKQFSLFDFCENSLIHENRDNMVKKDEFRKIVENRLRNNFGVDVIENIRDDNIITFPDNRFAMIKRVCPYCGKENAVVKEWEKRTFKSKKNKPVKYYPQSYICKECNKWFITPVEFKITKKLKENSKLDDKILQIYSNTGLSYDKIAEIIEITMNINISHEYIRSIVQKEHEELKYQIEIIPLPEDFKKGKTSQERGVTDIGTLTMFKNENIDFSGEIIIDELFTDING